MARPATDALVLRARARPRGGAIVLAGLWAVAAYLLWSTSTVPSLRLSGLDVHRYFARSTLHATAEYGRVAGWLWIGSTLAVLAAGALYARFGPRLAQRAAGDRLTIAMLLAVFGIGLQWLAALPFQLLQVWWDRKHGLSHASYVAAIFANWLGLGGVLFVSTALFVVLLVACRFERRWWIAATPCFIALAILMTFATPYALGNTHPLHNRQLRPIVQRLERREGVRVPVEVEPVRSLTSEPNAEAIGLGPSRRIVIWDTMLDGRFSPRELRVVIAHELAHQRQNHLWKSIGWSALFLLPTTFLIAGITRRRGGITRPQAIPLALLVFAVLQLVLLPARNAVSRHFEQEADWIALQTTHDPRAARQLFRTFAVTAAAQPDPPTWQYVLLDDHPTLAQRIALANASTG